MKAYAVSLLTTSVRLTDKYVSDSHSGIGAVAKKAMKQKAALLLHGLFILLFIYLNFGDTVVIPSVSFISAFDIKGYIGSFHGFIKGQAERFHLIRELHILFLGIAHADGQGRGSGICLPHVFTSPVAQVKHHVPHFAGFVKIQPDAGTFAQSVFSLLPGGSSVTIHSAGCTVIIFFGGLLGILVSGCNGNLLEF